MSEIKSQSHLLDQGIITFSSDRDVLVMIFSDCVMYVRCDLIDGKYAHFNPEDWLQVEPGKVDSYALIPLDENRSRLRQLLAIDYAYKINLMN